MPWFRARCRRGRRRPWLRFGSSCSLGGNIVRLAGRALAWGGLGWGGLVGSCLLFLFLVVVVLFDLVEGGELEDFDVCAGGFACDEGEGLGCVVTVE